ncbi:MAG: hypothetical protein LKJ88_01040 [Bacilli bacterium]|jgi:hypothetical protein|nr:hypothetical protein [Bacilli bacterium]
MNKEEKKKNQAEFAKIDSLISTYKKGIAAHTFKENEELTVITVDLSKIDIYKDCSSETLLNDAIYEFAEDMFSSYSDAEKVSFSFVFPEGMKDEEKQKIKDIFHIHYGSKYKAAKIRLRKQMILSLIFVFIGFILLSLHLIYTTYNADSIYGEIIEIFAWVFIWEAAEALFVNSIDNRSDLNLFSALYLADLK